MKAEVSFSTGCKIGNTYEYDSEMRVFSTSSSQHLMRIPIWTNENHFERSKQKNRSQTFTFYHRKSPGKVNKIKFGYWPMSKRNRTLWRRWKRPILRPRGYIHVQDWLYLSTKDDIFRPLFECNVNPFLKSIAIR